MHFDKTASLNTLQLHLGKRLIGSEGGQSVPDNDIPNYLKMIDEGLFNLDHFISHRYRLDDINKGISAMREGESLHSIVHF